MDNFFINYSYHPLNEYLSRYKNIYVLVDSNLYSLYQSQFGCFSDNLFILESSETAKSFDTVQRIIEFLLNKNADRDSLLIGFGGGIATDICGFVASIYKRGIKFGLIPTTLTAQIDAAIGGKTGINFYGLKNIVGTFAKAEFIYINPSFLNTLSKREFLCGWAELIKTFIIGDKVQFYNALDLLNFPEDKENDLWKENLMNSIRKAVEIKSRIVEKDRLERGGLRACLNLGHTFGHAIEACCHYFSPDKEICKHGEAVAAGIIIAAQFSHLKGLLPTADCTLIKQTVKTGGLPSYREIMTRCNNTTEEVFTEKLLYFMGNDKKCKEDFINFVFITGIGSVKVLPTPITEIEYSINDLCND